MGKLAYMCFSNLTLMDLRFELPVLLVKILLVADCFL